jgi:hypothetical protein
MISELYHTGLVVDDLRTAMKAFSAALGVEWAGPVTSTAPVRHHERGIVERESLVAFSRGGPQLLELIQPLAGGLWDPPSAPRLHHLGFWVADIAKESARLAELGMPVVLDGGSFVYHDSGQGSLYFELNCKSRQALTFAFIHGEG